MTDYALGTTVYKKFTTRAFSTGAPTQLAGTPAVACYPNDSTTQITAGITLSVDFDSVTGLNHVTVVATSGNGYAAGTQYDIVITAGTVGGVSVVGEVVASFSLEAESALRPTTAGRTLDVTATGAAGIDWANIEGQTENVVLSGTMISTSQSIASVSGAVGSVTGAVGSVTGAVGSVTADVGITAAAVDLIWDEATSGHVTAGTFGVAVKDVLDDTGTSGVQVADKAGYSISGSKTTLDALNDLSAAQVNSEVDTALADIHLDHLLAVDYDPAAPPGVSTALLNELIESDAGVSRFTANALEQAPGAAGDATAANQTTIINHLTDIKGGTFSGATDSLEAIRDRGDAAWTEVSAAEIRSAVGLASADLDTQLSTIDGNVDAILLDTGTDGVVVAAASKTGYELSATGVDAIWDEDITTHTTDQSAGLSLFGDAIRADTAQAGASGNITLDSGASATTDIYTGLAVSIVSGTGAGQSRVITAYNGTTKVATVLPTWTTNPASGSKFVLRAAHANVATFRLSQPNALASGRVDSSVGSIAANAITASSINTGAITAAKFAAGAIDAAAIATGAIDADALAADAGTEIGTAVWASATRQLTSAQTFNLTGDVTGNLSGSVGSVTGTVGGIAGTITTLDALDTAQDTQHSTTQTHLTDIKGATFSGATDSLEAIRDRGDAAWTTGAGGSPPDLLQNTTIATLASQTSFTLTAGSADDDAYNGALIVVTDSATSTQKAVGTISDYVGSTKTVTLSADPAIFTMAVGDTVDIIAVGSATVDTAAIADAVWDEATAGHVTAGTYGVSVTDILTDTGTTLDGKINTIDTNVDAILADTGTDGVVVAAGSKSGYALSAAGVDAIWDEPTAGHVTASTFGVAITDILADTGTTLETHLTDIKGATFSGATDSLEAIRDRGDAAWTTGAGGSPPDLLQSTTIATLASQTSFTLTAGSADDDAYNGAMAVVTDSATSTQKAVGTISDYVGSTKTVTLSADPAIFTMAVGDTINIVAVGSATVDTAAIADAVWDEATSGHVTAGTYGVAVSDILTDTGTTLDGKIDTIDANVDAVLADTGTDGVVVAAASKSGYALSAAGVDAIWDEATSGHVTAGTYGVAVTDILDDTGTSGVQVADKAGYSISGTKTTLDALNDVSTAQVNAEIDTALADIHLDHLLAVDYDPAAKPGTATALLNELVESDAGVSRFTANALEQAAGGGDATAANQSTIITHLTDIKGATWASGTDTLEAIRDRGDAAWTTGGDATAANQASISSAIAALNDLAASDVLTQVNAAIDTAISELAQAQPTATPTLRTGLMLLYMIARNQIVGDGDTGEKKFYNDAGTVVFKKPIAAAGNVYTESEMATGP